MGGIGVVEFYMDKEPCLYRNTCTTESCLGCNDYRSETSEREPKCDW